MPAAAITTLAGMPEGIRGVEPSWAPIHAGEQVLAWGPFIVKRIGGEDVGWALRLVEDDEGRFIEYSMTPRVIRLRLIGSVFPRPGGVEALVETGAGREVLTLRPVRDTDARFLLAPVSGSVVDAMRQAIGW